MSAGGATWALHTALDVEALAVHLPAMQAAGLLGLDEDAQGRATAYFPDRAGPTGSSAARDGRPHLDVPGRWEEVPATDWLAEWKRGIAPVTVGGLTIAPPWLPHDDEAVLIEIGQAFGTGHHETTVACLAALQELDLVGRAVLDVGTGSGILAICARRLGAARVVAVDVDPVAVAAARENAAVNGVDVAVRQGSADAVDGAFDVVVANLDTDTVGGVARHLVARVAPGGVLLVSGISNERVAEAEAALLAAGVVVATRPGREWALLTGTV